MRSFFGHFLVSEFFNSHAMLRQPGMGENRQFRAGFSKHRFGDHAPERIEGRLPNGEDELYN
jgi:hypothetical protein